MPEYRVTWRDKAGNGHGRYFDYPDEAEEFKAVLDEEGLEHEEEELGGSDRK